MRVKLLDCVNIIGGGTPNTKNPLFWGGNIGWLSVDDFKNVNAYVFDSAKTITKDGLNNSSTKLLNINDIIISARGTVGVMALIGKQMAFNQSCFGIRVKNTDILNPVYLFYLLKTNVRTIFNIDHSSIFDTINMMTFQSIEIDLPDRKTQDKIAEILSGIDEQIERNNMIVKRLQDLAQTTYSRWFNLFEFPNEDGLPYKSSGGKMVWNEELKREIPEGWKVASLGKLTKCCLGGTPKREKTEYWNGDLHWINSGEVANFPIVETTEKITHLGLRNSATELMPTGTTVVSITGNIRFSLNSLPCCANQSVVGVFETKNFKKSYLFFTLKENEAKYVNQMTGAIQKHINKDIIESTLIIVADEKVLKRYYSVAEPILQQIIDISNSTLKLRKLKEKILPLLINGQLSV